jgi:hypothetical protein
MENKEIEINDEEELEENEDQEPDMDWADPTRER